MKKIGFIVEGFMGDQAKSILSTIERKIEIGTGERFIVEECARYPLLSKEEVLDLVRESLCCYEPKYSWDIIQITTECMGKFVKFRATIGE